MMEMRLVVWRCVALALAILALERRVLVAATIFASFGWAIGLFYLLMAG